MLQLLQTTHSSRRPSLLFLHTFLGFSGASAQGSSVFLFILLRVLPQPSWASHHPHPLLTCHYHLYSCLSLLILFQRGLRMNHLHHLILLLRDSISRARTTASPQIFRALPRVPVVPALLSRAPLFLVADLQIGFSEGALHFAVGLQSVFSDLQTGFSEDSPQCSIGLQTTCSFVAGLPDSFTVVTDLPDSFTVIADLRDSFSVVDDR
ncbi:hypothetical protein CRENBAI_000347 [Crenichthys baileyi]|uniref:Uncharacterized protein n=1 Tax=Crenichthys baileyi TaxID=28760 RepID=A0AAV9QNG2_9TELE